MRKRRDGLTSKEDKELKELIEKADHTGMNEHQVYAMINIAAAKQIIRERYAMIMLLVIGAVVCFFWLWVVLEIVINHYSTTNVVSILLSAPAVSGIIGCIGASVMCIVDIIKLKRYIVEQQSELDEILRG